MNERDAESERKEFAEVPKLSLNGVGQLTHWYH